MCTNSKGKKKNFPIKRINSLYNKKKENPNWFIAAVAHTINTGHTLNFENPHTLATETNYRKRALLEMLHIKSNPNTMNKNSDVDSLHPVYASLIGLERDRYIHTNNETNNLIN